MIASATRSAPLPRGSAAGFTLVELAVYLVMAGVVLLSLSRVMITQGRGYRMQGAALDANESVRGAAAALAWDVRQAAAAGSQLAALNSQALTLRSMQGVGIVCAKHATLPRFALWKTAGDIQATADDSVLVYSIDQKNWRVLKIKQVGTPLALGLPACAWPGVRLPDLAMEVVVSTPADTATVRVGAAARAFRVVQYGTYQDKGRWWLGRKVGAGAFEKLTGPLLSSGLTFAYYDTLGAVTATPAAVGTVQFTIRTESFRPYAGAAQYRRDSLTSRVALRR